MPPLPDKSIVTDTPDQPLEWVLVLRKCIECGERKPLAHFLLHIGKRLGEDVIVGDVKVCATCRQHHHDRIRRTPRRLGRYLDLPLDDWAERWQSA